MKTIALLFLIVIGSSGIFAANKNAANFVIIGDQTLYCDNVYIGPTNITIQMEGTQSVKVPTNRVNAYARGGCFYEYLPVMNENRETTGWAFMQFIASRDGKRLYRFCSDCIHYDPISGKIAPEIPVYRYYTFKGGEFVSVTNDQNVKEQLAWFGVKVPRKF